MISLSEFCFKKPKTAAAPSRSTFRRVYILSDSQHKYAFCSPCFPARANLSNTGLRILHPGQLQKQSNSRLVRNFHCTNSNDLTHPSKSNVPRVTINKNDQPCTNNAFVEICFRLHSFSYFDFRRLRLEL